MIKRFYSGMLLCGFFCPMFLHADHSIRTTKLSDLCALEIDQTFEYVGLATIYDISSYGMTVDDGSTFITLPIRNFQQAPNLDRGEILHYFKGYVTDNDTKTTYVDGSSIETLTEYYTAELYPIIANKWEGFEDFPNRMTLFQNVSITDDYSQPGYYTATSANGSKALIDKSSVQGICTGTIIRFVATPRIGPDYTTLSEVNIDYPIRMVASLSELFNLPYSSVFKYDGESTVYYSSESQGLVLDDGDRFSSLSIEYIPYSQWPNPGEVITSFTGRIKYRDEESIMAGGIILNCRINGTSITKSGNTQELIPIVANENESFACYYGRLSTFHNIDIVESNYADNESKFMVKQHNGSYALLSPRNIVSDSKIELGKYDSITCVPLYSNADPYPQLVQVTLGNKTGVTTVSSDSDKVVMYLDVFGRSYEAKPSTPGIYIVQYHSGYTCKIVI